MLQNLELTGDGEVLEKSSASRRLNPLSELFYIVKAASHLIASLFLLTAVSKAATVIVPFGGASDDLSTLIPIFDDTGMPVQDVVVSVGYIPTGGDPVLDFQIIGTSLSSNISPNAFFPGVLGFGASGVTISLPTEPSNETPIGESIAIFVENPSGGAPIVFESSILFEAEPPTSVIPTNPVLVDVTASQLRSGRFQMLDDNQLFAISAPSSGNGAFFFPVPEPNIVGLSILSLMALSLRRSRVTD